MLGLASGSSPKIYISHGGPEPFPGPTECPGTQMGSELLNGQQNEPSVSAGHTGCPSASSAL